MSPLWATNPGAWAWPLPPLDFPDYHGDGWIFDEDQALRDLMKGMIVTDQENRQRHVEAWFGHPDKEMREQKYPYVTVDLLAIEEGKERVHRGHLYIKDPPWWWGLKQLEAWQVGYILEMPTPVDLDYQISTWARNPRHDRQTLFQLITGGRTMLRNGLLYTADDKIRRMDYLGHVKRDIADENNKRLFNNVFRVRISSEVPWGIINSDQDYGFGLVSDIKIKIKDFLTPYGKVLDETSITYGEVMAVDVPDRSVTLKIKGESQSGVRVSYPLVPVAPPVGAIVAVSQEPLVESPTHISDYRNLVIGIEELPQVTPLGAQAGPIDSMDGGT